MNQQEKTIFSSFFLPYSELPRGESITVFLDALYLKPIKSFQDKKQFFLYVIENQLSDLYPTIEFIIGKLPEDQIINLGDLITFYEFIRGNRSIKESEKNPAIEVLRKMLKKFNKNEILQLACMNSQLTMLDDPYIFTSEELKKARISYLGREMNILEKCLKSKEVLCLKKLAKLQLKLNIQLTNNRWIKYYLDSLKTFIDNNDKNSIKNFFNIYEGDLLSFLAGNESNEGLIFYSIEKGKKELFDLMITLLPKVSNNTSHQIIFHNGQGAQKTLEELLQMRKQMTIH